MRINSPEMLNHVVLTKEDVLKLKPMLSGWPILSKYYSKMTKEEVEKCIILELNMACRKSILERLLSKYGRLYKNKLEEEIAVLADSPVDPSVKSYLLNLFK